MAEPSAGDYLAARHASYLSDYKAGAEYYTKALLSDPTNPVLLENALVSFVGLGDFGRAIPVARKMESDGIVSQISRMVLVVALAKAEDYDALLAKLDKGETVGPLVDGLIAAWAEIAKGNKPAAMAGFDEVAQGKGMRSFGLYHKALALASIGDFDEAEKIFAGDASGPVRITVGGVLAHAEILSQLGHNDDGLEMLSKVFGDEPDPRVAQLRDALKAGDKVPFSMVHNANEGMAEVFFSVASALKGETDDGYTLIYSRMAEQLNPNHIDAILLSAGMLERLERYDLATDTYNRVPRDDPSFFAAEQGRAAAMRKAGKEEAALEVLQQLAKSHGNLPSVHSALGDAYRQQKRYEEAAAAYDRAVGLSGKPTPDDWFLYYARGISRERIDDWAEAEADFRLALELNPNQPQVLNYLGYSLLEHNIKLDEALKMIQRAVLAQPNDGYITDSLGWALFRLGKYDEAMKYMQRAAELTPVDPIVTDHLGDALWAVGRKLEARFQWRRALSYGPEPKEVTRIRRKLEVGLDAVLEEEGADPIPVAANGD
ncbi:MAG TPA: tetratricopeptide repeat protein [Rhodobacteraceae bacterium]|nr:tetratricopeptide repeat protein [Paracoccaceae bacterium]